MVRTAGDTGLSRAPTYTTDNRGDVGGLAGWVRILRNGNPVQYLPTQAEADKWISRQSWRKTATGVQR